MRRNFLEFEVVFAASTFVVHAAGWGRAIPKYGGIESCHKFCSGKRGRRGPISNILHEQGLARCRDQIPTVREMGTCSCGSCSEAETILSGILRLGNNKPIVTIDSTQVGCLWSASEMGHRTE